MTIQMPIDLCSGADTHSHSFKNGVAWVAMVRTRPYPVMLYNASHWGLYSNTNVNNFKNIAHSEKGYQNGAHGVLLLQIVPIEEKKHPSKKDVICSNSTPGALFRYPFFLSVYIVLKPLKIRPPGTFCLIVLQPDHLSKICMTLFYQWPEMLKLKMWQIGQFFVFNFSSATIGAFQILYIFSISCHLVKNVSHRFLKDGLVVK